MAEGRVASGHQNRYKDPGTIDGLDEKRVTFQKGSCNPIVTADSPPCWSAGTPVDYPDGSTGPFKPGEVHPKKTLITHQDLKMLVSTEENGELEYHPLIQLYNEIMADIFNHGMGPDLSDLKNEQRAMRLWRFLELRYLRMPRLMDEYCRFVESEKITTPHPEPKT